MSAPGYPSYRESVVDWNVTVPTHWTDTRLRFVARFNPSKTEVAGRDRHEEVSFIPMEAVGDDGTIRLDQTREVGDVEAGYTYFADGDVTFAKITPCFENGKGAVMRGLKGGIGFGTTELTVARPTSGTSADFLHWLFTSPPFRKLGEGSMYGAGGQKRVPDDFVRDFRLALPSFTEQVAIAAFLDSETGKIDALVEAQRRLIALLKEKRQAVISHTVTKGLNPAAPTKNSGIEWLGEVPAHWEVKPLKHLVHLKSGGTPSKDRLDYWSGDIPWASAKDLKSDELVTTQDFLTQAAVDDGAASISPAGSIFVLVRGMMLARTFPVCQAMVPMAINQDLKAITGRNGTSNAFIGWLLRGTAAETLNRLDEAGHGTKALRMEAWLSMPVPLPPTEEQTAIVEAVKSSTGSIDALIEEAVVGIRLLSERRAALISAAVTGKIDVRRIIPEQADAA